MSQAESTESHHPRLSLGGADIEKLLTSTGPIVKAVLLRCRQSNDKEEEDNRKPATKYRPIDEKEGEEEACKVCDAPTAFSTSSLRRLVLTDLIEQIEIDTTPQKFMVAKTLGGPFTFLGQYEDEGIVLMIRNLPDDLEDVVQMEREEEEEEDNEDCDNTQSNILAHELSRRYKASQLKTLCHQRDIDTGGMLEKGDLIKALLNYQEKLLPYNPHQLQPPLHKAHVRGDILCLKVAQTAEELDVGEDREESNNEHADNNAAKDIVVMSNEEFFLDYTRDEYIRFASRTDIPEHEPARLEGASDKEDGEDDEEEEEEEEKEEEIDHEDPGLRPAIIPGEEEVELKEEDKNAIFNMIMNEVLRQYREDNGRGPNTKELLELRASIAKELNVEVAQVPDADWNEKAKNTPSPSSKKIAFKKEDKVKEFVPHEDEYNYDVEPGVASAMDVLDKDDDDNGDDSDDDDDYIGGYSEPPSKKRKTIDKEDDGDDGCKMVGKELEQPLG
jgi:hypothetical protein